MVAYGALAIGASNVYGLPWDLDIFQKQADALQSGLDHGRGGSSRSHRQQRLGSRA